jgi:hypothetical protein
VKSSAGGGRTASSYHRAHFHRTIAPNFQLTCIVRGNRREQRSLFFPASNSNIAPAIQSVHRSWQRAVKTSKVKYFARNIAPTTFHRNHVRSIRRYRQVMYISHPIFYWDNSTTLTLDLRRRLHNSGKSRLLWVPDREIYMHRPSHYSGFLIFLFLKSFMWQGWQVPFDCSDYGHSWRDVPILVSTPPRWMNNAFFASLPPIRVPSPRRQWEKYQGCEYKPWNWWFWPVN